ncbi:MAG: hypothetical protein E7641_03275 [Ruminococcaceae bacterium]|nr:hypothetical protein [Oscillospiraceae bacterium]
MNSEEFLTKGAREIKAPRPKPLNKPFIYVALLLLCYYLPCVFTLTSIEAPILEAASIVAIFLGVFAYYNTAGSFRPVLTYSLFLLVCFLMGTPIAGMAAALITSTVVTAYLFSTSESKGEVILLLAIPTVSFAAAFITIRSIPFSALALLHLPAALTLALSIKKRVPRVSTILRTSIAVGAVPALAAVGFYVYRFGLDLAPLHSGLDRARSFLVSFVSESVYISLKEFADITAADVTAMAESYIYLIFLIIPAIFAVTSLILAFSFHGMTANVFIQRSFEDKEKIRSLVTFNMSIPSAVIFLTMTFIAAVFSAEEDVTVAATALNILLMLMPGMFYTALVMFRIFTMTKKGSCLGTVIYALLVLTVFFMPTLALQIAPFVVVIGALAGSVIIILNGVMKKVKEKQNKQ